MDFALEVRNGDLIATTGRVIVTLRAMTGEDEGWWRVILNPNDGRMPVAKSFSQVGEAFQTFGDAAQVFSFYGDRLRRIREDLALPVTDCDLDTTCRIERFFRGYCHCPQ